MTKIASSWIDELAPFKAAIAAHERKDGAGSIIGGSGLTQGKFREPTLSRLVNGGRIGQAEIMAIDEIEKVYSCLCGNLFLRGYEIKERTDRAVEVEPKWFIESYKRYRMWADFWSERKKTIGDKTLSVIYDILFSRRSGKEIDDENGWRHGLAINIFVAGLQDYAASAGWVDRGTGLAWQEMARSIFPLRGMRARSS